MNEYLSPIQLSDTQCTSAYIISDSNFTDMTSTHKFAQMRKLYVVSSTPAAVVDGLISGRSLLL